MVLRRNFTDFAGRTLSMLFVGKSAVAVLMPLPNTLRCMGFFTGVLVFSILPDGKLQGLGYSGRCFSPGVTEMIARTVVCLGFVGTFGFTAICLQHLGAGQQQPVIFSRPAYGASKVYKNACIYSSGPVNNAS